MTTPHITQADHMAAKSIEWVDTLQDDHDAIAQAFALHRTQARDAALEEGLEQWDGLARQIMMGFDMGAKTPRALLQHLKCCAETIPSWLREEPEMAHLDHTMSKGTRCVLIYRAMTEPIKTSTTNTTGD